MIVEDLRARKGLEVFNIFQLLVRDYLAVVGNQGYDTTFRPRSRKVIYDVTGMS